MGTGACERTAGFVARPQMLAQFRLRITERAKIDDPRPGAGSGTAENRSSFHVGTVECRSGTLHIMDEIVGRFLPLHGTGNGRLVADVAAHDSDVIHPRLGWKPAAVAHEHGHRVTRGNQHRRQIAPDVPGCARDENVHGIAAEHRAVRRAVCLWRTRARARLGSDVA